MVAISYPENFVTIRKIYSRWTEHNKSRLKFINAKTPEELDYQQLLSEANENFFHHEFTIALQNYLALRNKILVQSHPEMPSIPGIENVIRIPTEAVNWDVIVELGRRHLEKTDPGGSVEVPLEAGRFIGRGEFAGNPRMMTYNGLGLDPGFLQPGDIESFRIKARSAAAKGDIATASKIYTDIKDAAIASGHQSVAAEILNESAAMVATLSKGPNRVNLLRASVSALQESDRLYALAGDANARDVVRENLRNVQAEIRQENSMRPLSVLIYEGSTSPGALISKVSNTASSNRRVGFLAHNGVKTLSLDRVTYAEQLKQIYKDRVETTLPEGLEFYEQITSNFVAFIPHLFFYILPIAIGDVYLEIGRYDNALEEYKSALAYPYLNHGIELPFIWLKIAHTFLRWGDELFRRKKSTEAQSKYSEIITTELTVPTSGILYTGIMAGMKAIASKAIAQIQGNASGEVNPKVGEAILQSNIQLKKIQQGLNFLGLSNDYFPIFRFKYLQAIANYLADNAVQAERAFMNFRATAEAQTMERMNLQNSAAVYQASVDLESKRLEEADLEKNGATLTREYAEQRRDDANAALDDWTTMGKELASINAALSWASVAGNDTEITYTGVRYKGEKRDFDTTVSDFYDTLTDWRESLNYKMQKRRLERQRDEQEKEVAIAKNQEAEAAKRYEIQQLSLSLAQTQLQGAQAVLEFAESREFNEDLWYQVASEMQKLARRYLDIAIYAAFLMERAYEAEFDRRLNRIRLDYGIGSPQGLLGGDFLKADIASFTGDYIQHAQKKNPVRFLVSLRDEFPAAFQKFVAQGVLQFRTDLELFDRAWPGTFHRKIKKIEIFVEGLIPPEGVRGTLLHGGITTEWKQTPAGWVKRNRVVPTERLILSSYQFRRDLAVFQPSEEMLDIFENLGPQGNWALELPPSNNNLDYEAITDIKLVLYFDSDFNASLADHVKSFYPSDGGRMILLSSRFHFPDEYFSLDTERRVSFRVHPSRIDYNHENPRLAGFGVRILPKKNTLAIGIPLRITRASDGVSVDVITNDKGEVQGDATSMSPFQEWKDDSPVDNFTVALGDGVVAGDIDDVHLIVDYEFTYRSSGAPP